MDGDTVIGVGLAVLGIGAPLTVAVAKYFANGRKVLATLPGYAPECLKQSETIHDMQKQISSLSDNVSFIRESVKRIEGELVKIQEKLE
jgi:hypothetical protein